MLLIIAVVHRHCAAFQTRSISQAARKKCTVHEELGTSQSEAPHLAFQTDALRQMKIA
jgi:hypothetical protein